MRYLIILFITVFLTGCGTTGTFSKPGASYTFEKQGDNIVVSVSDTQEIKDLDASAEPIVLKDGTVICCRVSIKKGSTKSAETAGNSMIELLGLIREVAPLLKIVP